MQKFAVQNFGCRASQADGAAIEAALAAKGMSRSADGHSDADWVILNTCTVTSNADDDLRQTVRRVHRENPAAQILVTGCYAQRAPEEIAQLPGVSMVVGNSHKTQIAELIAGSHPGFVQIEAPSYHAQVHVGDIFARHDFLASPVSDAAGDRSRPNLKIQDGCNNRCSFCIIPFVRGRSRSMPVGEVIEQVRALTAAGYPEVVLSGINLGRWGREPGFTMRLPALLRRILDETEVQKLRLSSIEPMDWSGELLDLVAGESRIAKHVHAPLQSGSDTVLRRMHRKYRPRHYEDRVRRARALMPDAAIGADVMVGFPGETDAEFEDSRQFIESLPFTYLHVFTYSERPGTPAADSAAQVPMAVRKERNRVLRELQTRKHQAFLKSLIGKHLDAVSLDGQCSALSDNFCKIRLTEAVEPRKQIKAIVLGVDGELLTAQPSPC
ncbi:tRNA (N(6)-L-threonylcarbamoyladenosine(37)-C(2))-methylthiotransferase MtaB [Bryobacterales bacterium F-183]|nr:tRNA (N(6)-L-threonylcarbamoyladenosine(37)-C(2))-methylthiotransferase MtaB [Bryobacterales bacterium F-183]